jgi:stage III sporulation protein SpoIIIAA
LPILENPAARDASDQNNRHPLTAKQHKVTDNLTQLLDVLPPRLRRCLEREDSLEDLLEIVLDLGRPAEARFPNRVIELCPDAEENIDVVAGETADPPAETSADPCPGEVTAEDIEHVTGRIGEFGLDNRAGIERTLHRISAIRNRPGRIVGLTCRIGRAVYGTVDIIRDIVEAGRSILMLGRPGVGKSTKLREVARILSDEFKKRVVIVDTSNEIAGDGDIPHPAIGRSRRMQVRVPEEQHGVMIEAVENHMPQVIVIDEIGTEQEAFAARTIAERGVQLIGTAHGNSLENLLLNPTLSDLVGGIQSVTLGDEEARKRGTQKTVLERKAPPTFDVIIEILEVDKLAIHHDVAKTVDELLRGRQPRPEIRVRNPVGDVEIVQRADLSTGRDERRDSYDPDADRLNHLVQQNTGAARGGDAPAGGRRALPATVRMFPYGVSRSRLERAIANLRVPATIARDINDADVVIALKATFRREPAKLQEARGKVLGTFVVKSNTYIQIENVVREIFGIEGAALPTDEEAALQEAEEAIERVRDTGETLDLSPQNSYIRRLQHQMVDQAKLLSESIGAEPQRRIRVSRP